MRMCLGGYESGIWQKSAFMLCTCRTFMRCVQFFVLFCYENQTFHDLYDSYCYLNSGIVAELFAMTPTIQVWALDTRYPTNVDG